MSFYNLKVIESGQITEVYQYQKPVFNSKRYTAISKSTKENQKSYIQQKKYTFNVARNKIRRLINANSGQYQKNGFRSFPPVFITLTYKQNQTERKSAIIHFKNFIKRFNYAVYDTKENKLKYLAISEYQNRGVVHFHFVAFNLPFTPADLLNKTWGYGRCEIKQIKKVRQIGAYISKYFSKGIFDTKPKYEKLFFCSKNLIKPIVKLLKHFLCFTTTKLYDYLKNFQLYKSQYLTQYFGNCSYWQFCLS